MRKENIWVVIPAYNEDRNIGKIIKKTKRYVNKIIVVDDGSKDKTFDVAIRNKVISFRHIVNLGKGAAIKTGCDFAIKNGAEALILLDADAQHDPNEIPNFLKSLKDADIVFGYRKRGKQMPLILRFGNLVINKATKLLYNLNLRDTQCGYRALTRKAYKKIRWIASDYSMESEMIANVGKKKLKYKEIPIQTIYSDKYKGTTVLDGIKIVLNMFWWRLTR
ncbi:glycosyltransferase family 2 protein [Candidatus Woesearchaeota archaeon]|nr:glycosyltransferase family 2 protein [Candidatus Woesearchaeota archaeon]